MLNRDCPPILLLLYSARDVLDYCLLSNCNSRRQTEPPNESFNHRASQHRELPTPRPKEKRETSRSSRLGLSGSVFGEADNTLWTYHPELSGVCERGWNERIGKHSLATTNLSHPHIPFTCIGLSLGGEVVQYALPARRTRPRAWLGRITLHHWSCTSKLAISTICKPQSKLACHRQVIVVSIVIAFACTLALQASRGWASDRSLPSCFRRLASKSALLALPP